MHGSKVCGNLLVMNFKVLVYSVSFPNPESLKNQKLEAWGVGSGLPTLNGGEGAAGEAHPSLLRFPSSRSAALFVNKRDRLFYFQRF